ncbi:MAG: SHD1 domain-containing protein [Thermoguttaceae bacterium]
MSTRIEACRAVTLLAVVFAGVIPTVAADARDDKALAVYKEAVKNANIDRDEAVRLLTSQLENKIKDEKAKRNKSIAQKHKQHSANARAPADKPKGKAAAMSSKSHYPVGLPLPCVYERTTVKFNWEGNRWTNEEIKAEITRLKNGGDVHFLIDQFHMQVGDAGFFVSPVKIRQVISRGTILAGYPDYDPYILHGIDTSNMTDNDVVWVRQGVAVTGTAQYTTLLGAAKTVLRVDVVPQVRDLDQCASDSLSGKEPPPKQKVPQKPERSFRTWTDATGSHVVEAEFRGVINRVVTLEKKDGEVVKVPVEKLSKKDQEWLRQRGTQR